MAAPGDGAARHPVRYGTSSWSDKSWVGSFYPSGTRAGDMLPLYAQHFDSVEADSTYYYAPSTELTRRWADVTPPGFLLASKMPRDVFLGGDARELQPARVLVAAEFAATLAAHAAAMQLLGGKCGPIVLQFPWFAKNVFAGLQP